MIRNLFFLFLLSSCSIVRGKTTYEVADTSTPVCTIWNGSNGAALVEMGNVLVRVQAPFNVETPLWGPVLVPLLPNIFNKGTFLDEINAAIELEVLPENRTVRIRPSQQKVLFDENPIELTHGHYSKRTKIQNEILNGQISKMNEWVQFQAPIRVSLTGGARYVTPQKVAIELNLEIDGKKFSRSIAFRKDTSWSYWPVWVPTMHTDEACKKKLPNGRRYLF